MHAWLIVVLAGFSAALVAMLAIATNFCHQCNTDWLEIMG